MEVKGPSRQPPQAVGEAGESSSSRKRARLLPEPQHPVNEIKRRAVVLDDNSDDDDMPFSFPCRGTHQCFTTPAPVPPPLSSCSESSVVRDATVNSSALDCGICFLPLKPPIFQCIVGHAVCSPCHDKLGVPRSCHVCRALTPGGYQLCHAMEQLVDSIRVPCPHAAHGCTDRPVYHNHAGHAQACGYAPCHCPGQACSFVGSMGALLLHFAVVHRWPCTTEDKAGASFDIKLHDGFNFITAIRAGANQGTSNKYLFLLNVERAPFGRTITEDKAGASFDIKLHDGFNFITAIHAGANQGTSNKYLFLLNVERAPFGRTITAFCIHPNHTTTAKLRLTYECFRIFDMCCMHHQSSEFKVACTDLSNGLPDPSKSFLFIVPRSALSDDEEFTKVTVVITQTPI